MPVYSPAHVAGTKLYFLVTEANVGVHVQLAQRALDRAAAGIEPTVSNHKSDALTTGILRQEFKAVKPQSIDILYYRISRLFNQQLTLQSVLSLK